MSTIPYYSVPGSPEEMTGFAVPVQMAVAPPARQQRVTVFFRSLMVIPHYFVLYFLSIAAFVVAFIGWWGALFTGQLPEFAATFLTGFYRWYTRVQAYQLLLTDVYPPFAFDDDPSYPVRIAVPPRERLNRLAVFFRFILVIPANLLGLLLLYGGTIVAFVAWLITLFTGKLPGGLHLAYVAMVRYLLRINCYLYLLTPTYPGGLFGDAPAVPAGAAVPPVDDSGAGDVAPGYSAPSGYETMSGYSTPGGPEIPAGLDASAGFETPGGDGTPVDYGIAQPSWRPEDWRLVLTSGAKQLLGWFIGLGAVLFVGYIVLIAIVVSSASSSTATTNNAIDKVSNAHDILANQLNSWESAQQACNDLTCVESGDVKAAGYLSSFASTLQATPMPSGDSAAAASKVYNDATGAAHALIQLSHATSVAQYQSTLTSSGLQRTLDQFDQDYNALGTALGAT